MSGSPFNPAQIAQDLIDALAGNGAGALDAVWEAARWWMNTGAAGQNLGIALTRASMTTLLRT